MNDSSCGNQSQAFVSKQDALAIFFTYYNVDLFTTP